MNGEPQLKKLLRLALITQTDCTEEERGGGNNARGSRSAAHLYVWICTFAPLEVGYYLEEKTKQRSGKKLLCDHLFPQFYH